jgi:hypothetical protein
MAYPVRDFVSNGVKSNAFGSLRIPPQLDVPKWNFKFENGLGIPIKRRVKKLLRKKKSLFFFSVFTPGPGASALAILLQRP